MISDQQSGAQSASPGYRQVLAFVTRLWLRQRGRFALGVTLTLTATGFDLSLPWAASQLVDAVAQNMDSHTVWKDWWMLLAVFAGFTISRNLAHRLWIPLAARNMQTVLLESFDHVLAAPLAWHTTQPSGAIARRLRRAMDGYDAVTDAATIHVVPALLVLLGIIAMVGWREPAAGILALLVTSAYITGNLVAGTRWIRPVGLKANATDAAMGGLAAEVLAAASTVKGYVAEARERQLMADMASAWGASMSLMWRRFVDLGLVQNLLLLTLLATLSGTALSAWTQGRAGTGEVAFAVTSFLLMSGYLRGFGDNLRALQRGLEDTSDALAFARLPQEHNRDEPVQEGCNWLGAVTFEGVDFAYPEADTPILKGFKLHVRPGETVAITGASGVGKSTLARLLQRFHTPHDGRITLDGQDIATLPLPMLRRAVTVVAQEPALLNRSIRDNIAYSRPQASEEEIVAAALAACAHEFIVQLPYSYNTLVGEHGARLSGGQCQRIALARALLVDAPVLVLDEATSALDQETESRVLSSIAGIRPQQTRIVIAHRPAAMLAADRVLWLQDGRAVRRD
ncbi:ABC transporter ATP-binding protein [Pseudomonas sp. A014]|uniref:ABC transporter ATP-binding protein n=1 Tax=Pseudomonas sp. A014 TaxID=3458058 RepID=UPI00403699DF